jgi:hypothetical protein
MTPQSSFMVLAPIDARREAELGRLLESMNGVPGHARPDNALVPFGQFDRLHVARFLVVDDRTLADNRVYGIPAPVYPRGLAFLGDVDGDADDFLVEVSARAGAGLRAIFSCCEGFTAETDLLQWMRAHQVRAAAEYVNWRGRTVRQVREEAALRDAVERHVTRFTPEIGRLTPRQIHERLRDLVMNDISAGRLTLSADAPTPIGWWIKNLLHLASVPAVLLIVLVALFFMPLIMLLVVIAVAVLAIVRLRVLEQTDPELCSRPPAESVAKLAVLEDHDVTNQFSAMGTLKPGPLRLLTTRLVLWLIDWTARHIYTKGRLARVRSIHFARWVFLDNRKRVIFLSNYDGSVESYMDDFINKVGFGLNVVFGNGIGYPRVRWLLLDGCHDERKFKDYLRRHQMPTQVWYKAYPGLTAIDLERNARLRQGLDASSLSERAAREWMALL